MRCWKFLSRTFVSSYIWLSSKWIKFSMTNGNSSVTGYLPWIQKDSITHMHGLENYVKEGLPFVQDLSLENSMVCCRLALLHSMSSFFLYWSPFSSLCTIFDSVSSIIDEVLLINPSSGGTDIYLVNFVIIFVSQMTLLRWLTFLRIPGSYSQSCSFRFISIFWH